MLYVCSQVLAAAGDPRLDRVLELAHGWLQSHLDRMDQEQHRRAFIDNVPVHAALMRAWQSRREGVTR